MRVIPPEVPQPQAIVENPPIKDELPLQAIEETVNSDTQLIQSEKPLLNQSPPEDKVILIRKKREYKAFMKLIKQGKYTSAYMTSKLLGVDKNTILQWLHTPKVLEVMNNEIDSYVSRINVSKDWKAQAYLLDKLEGTDSTKDTQVSINNLIQVNTVAPSTTKSGTVTI